MKLFGISKINSKFKSKIGMVFIVCGILFSQSLMASTIYLVRHAEKLEGKDPILSSKGIIRAQNLAYFLENAHITHVYSTQYKRTSQTAQPTANMLGISIKYYDPRDLEQFAHDLATMSGNILVVGHSNTTPQLVSLLAGKDHLVQPLTENSFGDIFQVIINGVHKRLHHFKIPQ
jgi:broad specificity phosphatase PhoE